MTDAEWNNAIIDLFGTNIVSLGNIQHTVDECIGFARILMEGNDPHQDARISRADANLRNPLLGDVVYSRSGDTLPMMFITYNVLSIPPSQREAFWLSPIGRQTLSSIISTITESSDF